MTDDRTPRSANAMVAFSESIRGPPSAASFSVAVRPCAISASNSVPEVLTKRPVGARQHLAHCLDGAQVRLGGADEVAVEVVPVGEVDDAVGCRGGGPQAVEVVEVAAVRLGALGRQGGGGLVRAGQAGDVVPGFEEFGDDGGTDVSGRAGDKDVHGQIPSGRCHQVNDGPPSLSKILFHMTRCNLGITAAQ